MTSNLTAATLPPHTARSWPQVLVGLAVLATGLGLAWGAMGISSDAGYGGVGPNFLPWLVSGALTLCGALIVWEACTGGFRQMDDAPDADSAAATPAYWPGFVWVSAGLLLNAALITTLGFVLSCTLCYVLAVQGLRRAQGQARVLGAATLGKDVLAGLLLAAPVYWGFTKFLAINLPGLTGSGWL